MQYIWNRSAFPRTGVLFPLCFFSRLSFSFRLCLKDSVCILYHFDAIVILTRQSEAFSQKSLPWSQLFFWVAIPLILRSCQRYSFVKNRSHRASWPLLSYWIRKWRGWAGELDQATWTRRPRSGSWARHHRRGRALRLGAASTAPQLHRGSTHRTGHWPPGHGPALVSDDDVGTRHHGSYARYSLPTVGSVLLNGYPNSRGMPVLIWKYPIFSCTNVSLKGFVISQLMGIEFPILLWSFFF